MLVTAPCQAQAMGSELALRPEAPTVGSEACPAGWEAQQAWAAGLVRVIGLETAPRQEPVPVRAMGPELEPFLEAQTVGWGEAGWEVVSLVR